LWIIASWPQKSINLILKFYLYVSKENKEQKLRQAARDTSLDQLSTCLPVMEFRFGAMLSSNWGQEYFDAEHIKCLRGPHLARGP